MNNIIGFGIIGRTCIKLIVNLEGVEIDGTLKCVIDEKSREGIGRLGRLSSLSSLSVKIASKLVTKFRNLIKKVLVRIVSS